MTEVDFAYLRGFLLQRSGLALTVEKRYLVDSRLGPLCRRLGLDGLPALVARLRSGREFDTERLVVEAMTTNETLFFRDRTPFDLLRDVLLPRFIETRAGTRRLRIWCAAASTGQEPYSLAMTLRMLGAKLAGWGIDILATDLSTDVIARAETGLYSQFEVQRGLPIQLLLKYFTQEGEVWRIAPELRAMVRFRPLNLLRDFSSLGTFDVVFCRNVLIYLDPAAKTDVLKRLSRCMGDDSVLILGSAETVLGLTDAFMPDPAHRGLYVKTPARAIAPPPRIVAGIH